MRGVSWPVPVREPARFLGVLAVRLPRFNPPNAAFVPEDANDGSQLADPGSAPRSWAAVRRAYGIRDERPGIRLWRHPGGHLLTICSVSVCSSGK